MKKTKIFSTTLSITSKKEVLAFLTTRLAEFDKKGRYRHKFWIATPNPEIVVRAQKDKHFAKILNSADISLADGVGLAQAVKFLALPAPKNFLLKLPLFFTQGLAVGLATFIKRSWLFDQLRPIKGREMFLEIMKLTNKKSWRVFLLGGEGGIVEKTAKVLQKSLKKAKLTAYAGPELNKNAVPINNSELVKERNIIKEINKFKPHLLFVGFGAPKQEKWLSKRLSKLNIGGAMVVGGTFDYLASRSNLPPTWLEDLGLEWLWRLFNEPSRIKRILTAFPTFPLKVFWYKMLLDTPYVL